MRRELEYVRECAKDRIQAGNEPTWSWMRHVKLIEAIDDFLAGLPAETPNQPVRSAPATIKPFSVQHWRTAARR